jgi:hypothetical protein
MEEDALQREMGLLQAPLTTVADVVVRNERSLRQFFLDLTTAVPPLP